MGWFQFVIAVFRGRVRFAMVDISALAALWGGFQCAYKGDEPDDELAMKLVMSWR
jgi:hypothetical protein